MPRERLHKVLARAGVASRRHAEELIANGHVSVDGVEIRSMGVMVDPETQDIRFDGEKIRLEPPAYYLVNKPKGYLCTSDDPQGRRTVLSLVRDKKARRLYTVGRLDEESEGLIIVTNDGAFANRVAHPRYGVTKTYRLKLHGYLDEEDLKKARAGVWLSSGRTPSIYVRLERRSQQFSEVTVKIREGQNRVLRRVFARLGHAVVRLQRVRIGPIMAKGLKRGAVRVLKPDEVKALLEASDPSKPSDLPPPPRRRRGAPARSRASSSEGGAGRGGRKPSRGTGARGRSQRRSRPGPRRSR